METVAVVIPVVIATALLPVVLIVNFCSSFFESFLEGKEVAINGLSDFLETEGDDETVSKELLLLREEELLEANGKSTLLLDTGSTHVLAELLLLREEELLEANGESAVLLDTGGRLLTELLLVSEETLLEVNELVSVSSQLLSESIELLLDEERPFSLPSSVWTCSSTRGCGLNELTSEFFNPSQIRFAGGKSVSCMWLLSGIPLLRGI